MSAEWVITGTLCILAVIGLIAVYWAKRRNPEIRIINEAKIEKAVEKEVKNLNTSYLRRRQRDRKKKRNGVSASSHNP